MIIGPYRPCGRSVEEQRVQMDAMVAHTLETDTEARQVRAGELVYFLGDYRPFLLGIDLISFHIQVEQNS